MQMLWATDSSEHHAEVFKDRIVAMKDCIEELDARFMSREEIDKIGQNIFKMMAESDQRKGKIENFKKTQELEEEEVQHLDEDNEEED